MSYNTKRSNCFNKRARQRERKTVKYVDSPKLFLSNQKNLKKSRQFNVSQLAAYDYDDKIIELFENRIA